MTATPLEVDFTGVKIPKIHRKGKPADDAAAHDARPRTPNGKLLTPKQIRARARRAAARGGHRTPVTVEEFEALYKPMDEWDLEELARGRPRDKEGTFRGSTPKWVTREVHEKALEVFTGNVKSQMNSLSIKALDVMVDLMESEEIDYKGKPLVPATTKSQLAMFFIEHLVGKPKQHINQDISVKLQGILGSVLVNPNQALAPPSQGGMMIEQIDAPAYTVGHLPGHTIPMGEAVDVEFTDDDFDLEEGE